MLTLRAIIATVMLLFVILFANAQTVTYNHDDTKMNQITVMETGTGALTPELYYRLIHGSYEKTAARESKLGYRTAAGIGAYQQVEYADSIEAYTKNRAKIEALNVADRQVDLAWQTEGSKISDKLTSFLGNINRIESAGGSANDRERWNELYRMFQTAIKATRESFMPNAQRKRQYLQIYSDMCKQNETLVKQLVRMHNKSKTAELLACNGNYQKADKAVVATAARGQWKEASHATKSSNPTTSSDN